VGTDECAQVDRIETIHDTLKQKVYERTIVYSVQVLSAPLSQAFANNFKLSSVPSATLTSLRTLFDQYRVNHVRVKWIPAVTEFAAVLTSGVVDAAASPQVYSVLDFDDDVPVTTLSGIEAYSTVRYARSTREQSRTYKPEIRGVVSNNGSTASADLGFYNLGGRQSWIDITDVDVQWLGTKWLITPCQPSGTVYELGLFHFEAFVSFRQSR
jgi:hypothetical protein